MLLVTIYYEKRESVLSEIFLFKLSYDRIDARILS